MKPTAAQHAWNGDEWTIRIKPQDIPSCSWWVCSDFKAAHDREVDRIQRSRMALSIRLHVLGGKLP